MTFFLQSELTTNDNGFIEKNRYEILFAVKLIQQDGKNALVYNEELDMYFKNPRATTSIYEVELNKIVLHLSDRLEKAEDFIRRAMYRYDWIQPKVNMKGEVISIENKEESKKQWIKIKDKLKNDYKGEAVDEYLAKLSLELDTEQPVYPALSQYFPFGLLFPAIPEKHGKNWERKRIIELSPYEEEQFEEQAVYEETTDGNRQYAIKGSLLPDSQSELETFEGYMIVPVNETFPVKTEINTSITKDGIISQWKFELERYL